MLLFVNQSKALRQQLTNDGVNMIFYHISSTPEKI